MVLGFTHYSQGFVAFRNGSWVMQRFVVLRNDFNYSQLFVAFRNDSWLNILFEVVYSF